MDRFVYKRAAIPLTNELELQWYIVEDMGGNLINQFLIDVPDGNGENAKIVQIDAGNMADAIYL